MCAFNDDNISGISIYTNAKGHGRLAIDADAASTTTVEHAAQKNDKALKPRTPFYCGRFVENCNPIFINPDPTVFCLEEQYRTNSL